MSSAAVFFVLLLLVGGAWFAAALDGVAFARAAGRPIGQPLRAPLYRAATYILREQTTTERPDAIARTVAPALYFALAAVGLSVVPFAPGVVAVQSETGIVLWGACEALTIVAVFLHGWAPNSPFPLIGAYRYVAIGLPAMLLSMFVLIAAALPAESLSVTAIVDAQREVWTVVRQPLGLPLFLLLGLTLALRGPMDYADGHDLATGTAAEASGAGRAIWQFARLAMLVSVAAMASAVFLGGHLGPVLPGPVWLLLKTAGVLALLIGAGHFFVRLPPSRMLTLLWLVLLPLSFANLALVGVEVLP